MTIKSKFPEIAKRDITVYKILNSHSDLSVDKKKLHGKPFKAIIKNKTVEGTLSIDVFSSVFLCHDDPEFDGTPVSNKFGHAFSWIFDDDVKALIVDGNECIKHTGYTTFYRRYPVEMGKTYKSDLMRFGNSVENGLHSFANRCSTEGYPCVAQCIIPKGSKYYVGIFYYHESYASNQLTYIKILE